MTYEVTTATTLPNFTHAHSSVRRRFSVGWHQNMARGAWSHTQRVLGLGLVGAKGMGPGKAASV